MINYENKSCFGLCELVRTFKNKCRCHTCVFVSEYAQQNTKVPNNELNSEKYNVITTAK